MTITWRPTPSVRLDLRSATHAAAVVLLGVADLRVSQHLSNWPYALNCTDISDRQLDELNVQVSDGHNDQLSCLCASVEVHRP